MTWNEITDWVERAQVGDRAAYGELVRTFQPSVRALAMARLRDPLEAQELAQEVFVHCLKKLPQLRDPRCFAGWLRQITVRMAINRQARRARLPGCDSQMMENVPAVGDNPLDGLIRAEQRAELWSALRRLKTADRTALVAFYVRGLSLKQMSREFEIPIGTVKRRLHVARARLRAQLEGVVEFEGAAVEPVAARRRELVSSY